MSSDVRIVLTAIEPHEHNPYFGFTLWQYRDYQLLFNPHKRLDGFIIRHSGVKTARGISVGDSVDRVRELYGNYEGDYGLPYASFLYRSSDGDGRVINIQIDSNVVTSIFLGPSYK